MSKTSPEIPRSNQRDVSESLRNRPSRFQATDGSKPPGVTERQPVVARAEYGLDTNGHGHVKDIAHGDSIETWRRNAEDFERIAVQRQALANDGWITGKIPLPERVADVCRRRAAAGLVILRTKQPPKNRLDAENVKEIAADADTLCFADLSTRSQIESLVGPDGDFGESFLALADLLPHGKSELGILARKLAGTPMAVCDPDGPQLLGVLDWNSAQADGVNELEDSGVGADAEREGKDGDNGEAGTEAKKTESVAKVLPE